MSSVQPEAVAAAVLAVAVELSEAFDALREFDIYFKSGNSVPIERATIMADSKAVSKMRAVLKRNSHE